MLGTQESVDEDFIAHATKVRSFVKISKSERLKQIKIDAGQDCRKIGHKEGYCNYKIRKINKSQTKSNLISQVNFLAERKYLDVVINGIPVNLQVDTASDITIISEDIWSNRAKPNCSSTKNTSEF